MKKSLLFAASLAFSLSVSAQIAETSPAQPLLRGVESNMYYPELSADGNTLWFSDADYKNPRVYDFTDNVTLRLDKSTAAQQASRNSVAKGVSVDVEGSKLKITVNGVCHSYTPVECYAGYCWPTLSPDGTKVMFVAAGKGIVVTDLKGKVIARPGTSRMEAPVWFGNNHIVAMNATDDGHQISSSQIVLMTVDGSSTQALTKPESMSMYPAASIDAGRVVYNTIDGRLYQINVKLK